MQELMAPLYKAIASNPEGMAAWLIMLTFWNVILLLALIGLQSEVNELKIKFKVWYRRE